MGDCVYGHGHWERRDMAGPHRIVNEISASADDSDDEPNKTWEERHKNETLTCRS